MEVKTVPTPNGLLNFMVMLVNLCPRDTSILENSQNNILINIYLENHRFYFSNKIKCIIFKK